MPKYMNEIPTAMITERMANPILENRSMVSISGNDHSKALCIHNPKFAIASSNGPDTTKATIAVIGSKKTIVRKIARLLLAIASFKERISMSRI